MKKALSITLSLIVGFIALGIIFSNFNLAEVLLTFSNATPWTVGGYVLAIVAILFTLVWRWQLIIASQGHPKVPLFHLFWYKLVGAGVSYITPSAKVGGEPVRAGLLSRHGIKFSDALSTVVIDKTIELTSSGLFFAIGAIILLTSVALPDNTKWLMIIVVIVFLAIIAFFYYQMFSGKDFFGKAFRLLRLHRHKKGYTWEKSLKEFESLVIKFYHKDKKYFMGTVLISLLSWAIMFLEYRLALLILGVAQTNFLQIFLIFSFIGGAYLIPIPMALGSLEASQVSVFALTKAPQSAGIALALLVRTKDLLLSVIGLIALSIYGLRLRDTIREARPITDEINRLEK